SAYIKNLRTLGQSGALSDLLGAGENFVRNGLKENTDPPAKILSLRLRVDLFVFA
ncbi:MAG: hypothetical protein IT342_05115, partial [Candidatus Melainabacteria bacterium]|nr:hypothetical protein [Candidatus Melainabacteria bacterium]